eukprot:361840-Chlamydomonas_euryale.AAC.7
MGSGGCDSCRKAPPHNAGAQDFGDMYTRLRTELVNDLLLGPRAPEFAKKRITEVGTRPPRLWWMHKF